MVLITLSHFPLSSFYVLFLIYSIIFVAVFTFKILRNAVEFVYVKELAIFRTSYRLFLFLFYFFKKISFYSVILESIIWFPGPLRFVCHQLVCQFEFINADRWETWQSKEKRELRGKIRNYVLMKWERFLIIELSYDLYSGEK